MLNEHFFAKNEDIGHLISDMLARTSMNAE